MSKSKHTPRVDCDQIAELYDSQPFRGKEADANLQIFLTEQTTKQIEPLCILEIGCGTGNQLVANRPEVPTARMMGMDRFRGMLK